MPEGGEEALGGEKRGMAASGDLGWCPVEFVDGGVGGWEGADVGVICGYVGFGGGFEVEGLLTGEDFADYGETAVANGRQI